MSAAGDGLTEQLLDFIEPDTGNTRPLPPVLSTKGTTPMPHSPVRNMARCALFAALLCICSWIAIPMPEISITAQTFGIFLTLGVLGGKWGTAACLTWLCLGMAGLPVFSGFRGGLGMLLGTTGGYLWGFPVSCLVYWVITARFGSKFRTAAMILGLLCCYGCGTAWYLLIYLDAGSLWAILLKCVVPYVIPDLIKLLLAQRLTNRLERFLR